MTIQACPTDVVNASVGRIWALLADAREIARWTEVPLLEGPDRPVTTGDRLVFGVGPSMRVIFNVVRMEAPVELELNIEMPFGILNHEVIHITPLGERRCRVTYN
jgi:hypothetical protein